MNVLFVVFDDLRPELGCYGERQVISPSIDGLAADGILFERAYCQQAVCAPSRSSVLSGCRPDTTGIYDLQTPLRKAMPRVLSLPEHFKNHGYETVSIGKVYHHPKDDLQGWSKEPFQSRGDWKGRGYLTDEAIEAMKKNDAVLARKKSTRKGLGPALEAADVPDDGYHDGRDAEAAINELRRLKGKTFFLALGFHKPHLPFNAPKKYWDMYSPKDIKLAENPFEPEGVTEYSLTNYGELRGYFGVPDEGEVPEELALRLIHGYCSCVSYVDAQLGRVLAELERLGLRENTIIILWGDHGWKLGEHASWCKHTNFEIDTRAPMILSLPGMKGVEKRTHALVEFVDMYPTLCELCGVPVPDHLEGLSFAPLIEEPDRAWKSAVFSQYPRREAIGYAMRTERFRYTEWRHRRTGDLLAREAYDHQVDPQENVSVVDLPEQDEAMKGLARRLDSGWRAAIPES